MAMQACGVNYRNASSTMPVCTDVDRVANNYGTNAARALYFGFMQLEADGRFDPERISRPRAWYGFPGGLWRSWTGWQILPDCKKGDKTHVAGVF